MREPYLVCNQLSKKSAASLTVFHLNPSFSVVFSLVTLSSSSLVCVCFFHFILCVLLGRNKKFEEKNYCVHLQRVCDLCVHAGVKLMLVSFFTSSHYFSFVK